MLLPAEHEVFEASANTLAPVRRIPKPAFVPFQELPNGRIPVRYTESVQATRLQTAQHLFEVSWDVREVLHDVVRVHTVQSRVMEWQWISEVGPDIDLGREHIGVQVDPAAQIILLS